MEKGNDKNKDRDRDREKEKDIKENRSNIEVNLSNQPEIETVKFQKMCFLFNALESGWSIKKRGESYIFTKNHEGKKEVFDESYLSIFMKDNTNINKLLS
jgi:hypothetical protein